MDAHAWNERCATSEPTWTAEPTQFVVAGDGRDAVWLIGPLVRATRTR